MMFSRPRRLRHTAALRNMIAQHDVRAQHLMMPHFIIPGSQAQEPVASMPGIARMSVDVLLKQVEQDLRKGIASVLLFGCPHASMRHEQATYAHHEQGLVQQAVRALKQEFKQDLVVATDVCLCAYTTHGHCGVLEQGAVLNDPSVRILSQMALSHAQAGADIVAPSDMMDGRVQAMRMLLDEYHFETTSIMSYSVKYASSYYGPFRDAAASAPGHGDRKSYQMDYRNHRDVSIEIDLDTQEGADIVMVKPALAYLDVIAQVKAQTQLPLACYNVSGEYSMVKAAAAQGYVDEGAIVFENFIAMRRAGADIIITYHARDAVTQGWLS